MIIERKVLTAHINRLDKFQKGQKEQLIIIDTENGTLKGINTKTNTVFGSEIKIQKDEVEKKITLDNKTFSTILKTCEGEFIELKKDEDSDKVDLICEGSKMILENQNINKYIDDLDCFKHIEDCAFSLEGVKFKDMLTKSLIAVSSTNYRPALKGVNINIVENIIEIQSTDGFKFTTNKYNTKYEAHGKGIITIPKEVVKQVISAIKKGDMVDIYIEDNKRYKIVVDSYIVAGYGILDKFPEGLNKLVPNILNSEVVYNVNVKNFLNTIKRASITNNQNYVELIQNINGIQVNSFSKSSLIYGENVSGLGFENLNNKFKVWINQNFLIDILKVVDGETVNIEFNGKVNPVVIREGKFIFLCLPTVQ